MTRPDTPPDVTARLDRVRVLCLALSGAVEKVAWGEGTFRAGEKGKLFAMFATYHHDDRVAVWLKAPEGAQAAIVASDPARFFIPPYQGPYGWIGAWLDTTEPDWDELTMLIKDGYRAVAGKKLLAQLESDS